MQCFPSIETTEFHKGLLSKIAMSFNRGRKNNQWAINLTCRFAAEPEMKPKPHPGAVCSVAAVTNLDSAATLTEKQSLCKSTPLWGPSDRREVDLGRSFSMLHQKLFRGEMLSSCMTLFF